MCLTKDVEPVFQFSWQVADKLFYRPRLGE